MGSTETAAGREIRLQAFHMNSPNHQSSGLWRHPRDQTDRFNTIGYWQDLAQTLERGLFDGIFLADVTGVYDVYGQSPEAALSGGVQIPAHDPFTLVGVMAAATEHLCFAVTGTVPYEAPYPFARRMSSLDHLTGGRLGWNVVTGYLDSAARAFGQPTQQGHADRYDRADDYIEAVSKLWEDSWDDDAIVADAPSGVYIDPDRVRPIVHHGPWVDMEAIHLCAPSPQRTPVIFQAGTSPRGQAFAARHAECVFVGGDRRTTPGLVSALRAAAGRDLKVFAMACVVVDETDEAAAARLADYQQWVLPEAGLALMAGWTGVDLSGLPLDVKATDIDRSLVTTEAVERAVDNLGQLTLREWGRFLGVGGAAPVIVGSPSTVADELMARADEGDIDGFNLAYTVMPESVELTVDLLVPELQRRGVYKTEYTPGTMRQKLFGQGDRRPTPT